MLLQKNILSLGLKLLVDGLVFYSSGDLLVVRDAAGIARAVFALPRPVAPQLPAPCLRPLGPTVTRSPSWALPVLRPLDYCWTGR